VGICGTSIFLITIARKHRMLNKKKRIEKKTPLFASVTMWDSYLKNKNTKKNNSWPVRICEVGQVLLKIRIPRKNNSWPV
jgi:hypothetical protein